MLRTFCSAKVKGPCRINSVSVFFVGAWVSPGVEGLKCLPKLTVSRPIPTLVDAKNQVIVLCGP